MPSFSLGCVDNSKTDLRGHCGRLRRRQQSSPASSLTRCLVCASASLKQVQDERTHLKRLARCFPRNVSSRKNSDTFSNVSSHDQNLKWSSALAIISGPF